jgi:MOSC domain-containing protein YiiM
VSSDFSSRFDRWIGGIAPSPKDVGTVKGLVLRPEGSAEGERQRVESTVAVPERGLEGDRWADSPYATAGNEVSLINVHFLRAISDGDEDRGALSGDNLHVDLDLSEENLPLGSRLSIGEAVLEVSDVEHIPCASFLERFGAFATKSIAHANGLGLRGRGVLCHVRARGEIKLGDQIRVDRSGSSDQR